MISMLLACQDSHVFHSEDVVSDKPNRDLLARTNRRQSAGQLGRHRHVLRGGSGGQRK